MKYHYRYRPGTTFYRSRVIKLSPESKAILERRRAAARAIRRAQFPQFYRDED